MKDSNRQFVLLLMGLILVLAALFINDFIAQRNSNRNYILNNFNRNLKTQINYLNSKFGDYFDVLDLELDNHWPLLERIEQNENIYAFVYKHDSLLYWNTSSVHFQLSSLKNRTFLINDASSWYLGVYGQLGDYRIILVEPIIQDYVVDNQFVKREVNKSFSNSQNIQISNNFSPEAYEIDFKSDKKYYLKVINTSIWDRASYFGFILVCILYLLLSIFIIHFIKNEYSKFSLVSNYYLIISFVISLFAFTLDSLIGFSQHYFPAYLQKNIQIIDLRLGELFLLSIIILVFVVFLYKKLLFRFSKKINNPKLFTSYLNSIIIILIINLVFWFSQQVLLSTQITEIFSLTDIKTGIIISSWMAIAGILIYASLRIVGIIFSAVRSKKLFVGVTLALSIGFGFSLPGFGIISIVIITLLLITSFLIDTVLIRLKQFYILHHLLYIILISGAIALLINTSINSNKLDQQKYISEFLVKKGDKTIEKFWYQLKLNLDNDTLINRLRVQDTAMINDSILDYVEKAYFTDKVNGFSYQITFCNSYDSLLLGGSDEVVDCQSFFNQLKGTSISNTKSSLFLLENEPDNIYYLGEFGIRKGAKFYIELSSYFIPGGLAYAELLIDKSPTLLIYRIILLQNTIRIF